MVKLTDVSLSFGEKQVLDKFSLTLNPGERVALMGPSGCGKTTVLRLVLGLLKPGKGRVETTCSNVAAVFQEPRLLPWRTAAENVNLVLGDRAATMPRARTALEAMGLGNETDRYPEELSGGMQQRVALARAVALEGDLLILDEPFKGLDEDLRRDVMEKIARTKGAILLVTHDREEAEALGCTIRLMGNSE